MSNLFDDTPVISYYSTRNGVEDGILVPLSGPLYPTDGDGWIPDMVREAGIRLPVIMTAGAFGDCVSPLDEAYELAPCQDIKGRLWDVLYLCAMGMRRNSGTDRLAFKIHVRSNVRKGSGNRGQLFTRTLIAALGEDEGGVYLTIMRPEDD